MDVSPLQITGWTSAWAGIGWLACHYLSIGREARARRRRYRSFIELLRQKAERQRPSEIWFEHRHTFPEFDKEALEVRAYIGDSERFDADCRAYRSVEFEIAKDQKNAEGQATVLSILDRILRYAK